MNRRSPPGSQGTLPRTSVLWAAGLLCLAVVLGVWLAPQYGVSTDEPDNVRVGMDARAAYQGSELYFAREALAEHGPIYFMFFTAASEAMQRVAPSWPLQVGRHLTNYLTFLLGTVFFYFLCLRLIPRPAALAASVLYFTQPILFGSAFINQKDIPFLTCCLGAVALGWMASDAGVGSPRSDDPHKSSGDGVRPAELPARIRAEWQGLRIRSRWMLAIGCALGLGILIDLVFGNGLQRAAEGLVAVMDQGRAPWPLQQLFDAVATDADKTPVALYFAKIQVALMYVRWTAPFAFLLAMIGAGCWAFPTLRKRLAGHWRWQQAPGLIGSALFLGAAIAIRQIGVFAGALVSLLFLFRNRGKGLVPILFYWAVAACVVYATWPYLWPDPTGRFRSSFEVIGGFTAHHVVFEGQRYGAGEAPWRFLPVVMGYQLTESALALFGIGLAALVMRMRVRRLPWLETALLLGWLLVPLGWVIWRNVPIYHNLRHMYFVLPPLFVIGGVGLEALASLLRPVWAKALLLLCVLAPGLLALVQLHPYQYGYFNSFAGGISGAAGRFETDYWCTSVKETTEYIGETAAPGDTLMVFGPIGNAIPYVRQDLALEGQYSPLWKADVVALCPHGLSQRWDPADFQLVHEVRRGEAVLGQVWRRVRPAEDAGVTPGG